MCAKAHIVGVQLCASAQLVANLKYINILSIIYLDITSQLLFLYNLQDKIYNFNL